MSAPISMSLAYELAVLRVFVHDWERAVRFYQSELGMALASRADAYGWAQFATGTCSLAIERLAKDDPEAAALVGRYVGVSLRVDDIETVYRTLRARGVEFLGAPEKQPWGGTLAHLRDPDGNVLTLLG